MRFRAYGLAALLVATTVVISACTTTGQPHAADTTTSQGAHSGEQVETVVDRVTVRATTAEADRGKQLTVTSSSSTIPSGEARVGETPAVDINLDGGQAQPSAPVLVEFDLSDRPDLVKLLDDSAVVPVLETVSENDPDQLDMFLAKWDSTTKTISAQITHLTAVGANFYDLTKVFEDGPAKVFKTLRNTSDSPCREKSTTTVKGVKYTLTALRPGAVAGCLVSAKSRLAIDFDNATGSFYAIKVIPDAAGGSWVDDLKGMSEAAGQLFSLSPGTKGVLAGRSNGRLIMDDRVGDFEVRLEPQQQGILAQSLMSAISMLGMDLDRFDNIPEAWDCLTTTMKITPNDEALSPIQYSTMASDIAKCAFGLAEMNATSESKAKEFHRYGSALEVVALLLQLHDLTRGFLKQVAHTSVLRFSVKTAKKPTTTPSATTTATPAATPIDRVELKTWAYNKVADNTYTADNAGRKDNVNIHVTSYAGEKSIRSGCTTTVSVNGPGVSWTKVEKGCYVGNPGLTFDAPSVGAYVVTAKVSQPGKRDIVKRITVTIVPS